MKNNLWIIAQTDHKDIMSERLKFWTGGGWSLEIPDALQLPYREAFAIVKRWYPNNSARLFRYRDYGTTAEKAIFPNSGFGY